MIPTRSGGLTYSITEESSRQSRSNKRKPLSKHSERSRFTIIRFRGGQDRSVRLDNPSNNREAKPSAVTTCRSSGKLKKLKSPLHCLRQNRLPSCTVTTANICLPNSCRRSEGSVKL